MGKASRFEELFLPYLDAAYNLARWMVGRDQDAAHIVQDAYARALQDFSEFHGDNPRAWLLTLVHNIADSWPTKPRQGKALVRLDEEPAPPSAEIGLSGLPQERQRQLLAEALTRLPAEFREVLLLFEFERWSYQAIAALLDEPVEAVIVRLRGARRHLQRELTSLHQISDSRSAGLSRTEADQNGRPAMQCEL
jgi:RNA polymerase sigma-70 factor, ECF subfamily